MKSNYFQQTCSLISVCLPRFLWLYLLSSQSLIFLFQKGVLQINFIYYPATICSFLLGRALGQLHTRIKFSKDQARRKMLLFSILIICCFIGLIMYQMSTFLNILLKFILGFCVGACMDISSLYLFHLQLSTGRAKTQIFFQLLGMSGSVLLYLIFPSPSTLFFLTNFIGLSIACIQLLLVVTCLLKIDDLEKVSIRLNSSFKASEKYKDYLTGFLLQVAVTLNLYSFISILPSFFLEYQFATMSMTQEIVLLFTAAQGYSVYKSEKGPVKNYGVKIRDGLLWASSISLSFWYSYEYHRYSLSQLLMVILWTYPIEKELRVGQTRYYAAKFSLKASSFFEAFGQLIELISVWLWYSIIYFDGGFRDLLVVITIINLGISLLLMILINDSDQPCNNEYLERSPLIFLGSSPQLESYEIFEELENSSTKVLEVVSRKNTESQ